MLRITFTVMGDVVLARALSRFGENVRDFSPVWLEIYDDFVRIEEEQFTTQGGRSGNAWTPLSLNYAEWKNKYFPGQPILVLTGALKEEMTGGFETELLPMSLRMSPNPVPALFHQRGTSRIPERKVVDLTEEDKMGWMKMIHRFVYERAKEEGLV